MNMIMKLQAFMHNNRNSQQREDTDENQKLFSRYSQCRGVLAWSMRQMKSSVKRANNAVSKWTNECHRYLPSDKEHRPIST